MVIMNCSSDVMEEGLEMEDNVCSKGCEYGLMSSGSSDVLHLFSRR